MGKQLTYWTIRAATALYALALVARMRRPKSLDSGRVLWTAGCLLYLVHVALAFHFFHSWSHSAAYAETARRTLEMFGVASGRGIYWNYLFTAVWTFDAAWWWIAAASYRSRSPSIEYAIQGFLAFMFFNAVLVFGSPGMRWFGALLGVALLAQWRLKSA
jgi:hypothetical protein